ADPSRRRIAAAAAASLVAVGAAMAVLFPGTGEMPFKLSDTIPAGLCCIGLAFMCRNRLLRIGSVGVLMASVLVLAVPSAVGANITRMAWVCTAPLAVGYLRTRGWHLAALVALAALWPVADLTRQLHSSASPSASAGFYQ